MKKHALAPLLLGWAVACGGGKQSPAAPGGGAAEGGDTGGDAIGSQQVRPVPIGECKETVVADGVKQVTSTGAGWSYLVPTDAVVNCSEAKAVLNVGAGLNIVFTSMLPSGEGAVPEGITELMVQKASEGAREADPEAEIHDVSPGSFGESAHPGHCGGARFEAEGQQLRTVVCSASAAGPRGAVHIMMAAITDTEEGFAKAGASESELFSQLVDNWKPAPDGS